MSDLKAYAGAEYGATFHSKRDSLLMEAIYIALQLVTWGGAGAFWGYATAIGTRIYHDGDMSTALLAHETTHLDQRRRMGSWSFLWAYATKRGRLLLEVEAYSVTNAVRRYQGEIVVTPPRYQVEALSGAMYLWAGDAEEVERLLQAGLDSPPAVWRRLREVMG